MAHETAVADRKGSGRVTAWLACHLCERVALLGTRPGAPEQGAVLRGSVSDHWSSLQCFWMKLKSPSQAFAGSHFWPDPQRPHAGSVPQPSPTCSSLQGWQECPSRSAIHGPICREAVRGSGGAHRRSRSGSRLCCDWLSDPTGVSENWEDDFPRGSGNEVFSLFFRNYLK